MMKCKNFLYAVTTGLVASTIAVTQAFALSCFRPDLANSFKRWSDSETHYMIARGTLTPTDTLPSKRTNTVDEQHIKFLEPVQYRFSGVLIGKNKSAPVTIRAIVEPRCLAVWCGGYPVKDEEAIYAFEKTESGYRFRPGPCGGDSFTGDTNAHEVFIRNCMKSGTCSK